MEMAISKELDWATAHRDHYLTDVKEKVLWEDKKSGAKAGSGGKGGYPYGFLLGGNELLKRKRMFLVLWAQCCRCWH